MLGQIVNVANQEMRVKIVKYFIYKKNKYICFVGYNTKKLDKYGIYTGAVSLAQDKLIVFRIEDRLFEEIHQELIKLFQNNTNENLIDVPLEKERIDLVGYQTLLEKTKDFASFFDVKIDTEEFSMSDLKEKFAGKAFTVKKETEKETIIEKEAVNIPLEGPIVIETPTKKKKKNQLPIIILLVVVLIFVLIFAFKDTIVGMFAKEESKVTPPTEPVKSQMICTKSNQDTTENAIVDENIIIRFENSKVSGGQALTIYMYNDLEKYQAQKDQILAGTDQKQYSFDDEAKSYKKTTELSTKDSKMITYKEWKQYYIGRGYTCDGSKS